MKSIIKEYGIELLSIVLVYANIFFNIFPVIPVVLCLLLLSLFRSGLIGAFVLSSYALPVVLGSTLYSIGITGVASLIQVILFFICLYHWRVTKRLCVLNFSKAIRPLMYIFLLLVISSIVSSGGNYAFIKCKDTIVNGILVFFSFALIFSNPEKCDCRKIGLYLILYSFLMLLLSPLLNNGSGPADLFDFGYLRRNNMDVLERELFTIDYQHVGTFATLGCAMIMLQTLWAKDNKLIIIGLILSSLSSLYSGARQSMIISVTLILLWSIFQERNKKSTILYACIGVSVVIMLVGFLFAEGGMLNSVKEDGYLEASNRDLVLLKGVTDFLDNPFLGVGYGRFFFGKYGLYPHNLIVELLCELGLIGVLIIFSLSLKPIIQIIKNYKPCVYLLVVYFLRSMTSGGLDSNIMLFGFISSTICISMNNYSNKKNNKHEY